MGIYSPRDLADFRKGLTKMASVLQYKIGEETSNICRGGKNDKKVPGGGGSVGDLNKTWASL